MKRRLILFADQPRLPPPGRWTIEEEAEERRIHRDAIAESAKALREQLGGEVEISVLFGFAGGILIEPEMGLIIEDPLIGPQPAEVKADPRWLDTITGTGE